MPDAPLVALRIRLKRSCDIPCCACGDTAVVIGQGTSPHAASLHCACCGRHRGWLPKAVTEFLTSMIRLFGPPPDGILIRTTEFTQVNAAAPMGAIAAAKSAP
jgi:hypothetical protein